ncbi:MAG: 16S rRNA (adenine(1518)-N(6)/adenine(1519)-N(6))-dimethyltransferase RsmA [Spirochaetaceae bacterium]|jgi:16S rRNA (adenine1518-N6/adenine1519-N6)-dimethyltransferase|nr:16S rRNA (adenine(1518)-N(6)/adenine(1519)-N(6))-dimethyltransferase RsmA [Spirochaetaceae bacterium]
MSVLPDYNSPQALKAYLDGHGMAMQKKFGQNFLVNGSARVRLADALELNEGSSVWEIGPGLGAMTAELLNRCAERNALLTAFEIDRGFCAALTDFFGENPRFSLVPGDVLKTWKNRYREQGIPDRLFGNLPYNVAAVVLADFISEGVRFDAAVVTVQREVAMRMAAAPGTEQYSSFSVLCQWAYDVAPVMDLAGGAFWPRPAVDSRAVKMTKLAEWPRCKYPGFFMKMQRSLFSSRRKTVKNNLSVFLDDQERALEVLAKIGIDPQIRAERLSVDELLALSDAASGGGM